MKILILFGGHKGRPAVVKNIGSNLTWTKTLLSQFLIILCLLYYTDYFCGRKKQSIKPHGKFNPEKVVVERISFDGSSVVLSKVQ